MGPAAGGTLPVAALWLVRLRLRALEDAAVELAQDVAAGALLGASAARRAHRDARADAKIGDAMGHGVLPPSLAECRRCASMAVTGKPQRQRNDVEGVSPRGRPVRIEAGGGLGR